MRAKKLVVLLYSGGLDTSVICHWLAGRGYGVICCVVDVAQGDDFGAMEEEALGSGAIKFVVRDIREEFVRDGLFWCMQAQAKYEGLYIPCTAVARPFIMREAIDVAHDFGAGAVVHGATAKGNDQVRFEFTKYARDDSLELIAPWRDSEFYKLIPGRKEAIEYARVHGIPIAATEEKPWSTDSNIGHTSHEAGVLEDPGLAPPDDLFERIRPGWLAERDVTVTIRWRDGKPVDVYSPQYGDSYEIVIHFKEGFPVAINGIPNDPVTILEVVNAHAGAKGIGIVDMVEDRFIDDMKSRGIYEAPGMTLLYAAYQALLQLCLNKEDIRKSLHLGIDYGQLIYEGFWHKDTRKKRGFDRQVKKWRKRINGNVKLRLYKGGFLVVGRNSPNSLYDQKRVTMERDDEYDPSGVVAMLRKRWDEYK